MNILYCDKVTTKNLSGGAVHIFEIVKGLSSLGHKVTILNRDFLENDRHLEREPLEISDLPQARTNWRAWFLIRNFRGEISFLGILAAELKIFSSLFFTLLKRHKQFDVIYRRHAVINSEWILARIFKIPSVLEVNGIVADELRMAHWGDPFSIWLVGIVEKYTLSKANAIITVTLKLKDILSACYSLKPDIITAVQNGTNTELFRPMNKSKARDTLNLKREYYYICFVGNLFPWQGVEHAIRSMPEILETFPKTQLLIVGNGPLKEELINLARQLDVLKSLIFVGEVPHNKVRLYINASDICIAPKSGGLKSGCTPLKLCEYMACKKPVVGSSEVEILEESQGGILVEPGNIHELTAAICRLLNSQELREQMGENGMRFVMANQRWEMVAERVSCVLQKTISRITT